MKWCRQVKRNIYCWMRARWDYAVTLHCAFRRPSLLTETFWASFNLQLSSNHSSCTLIQSCHRIESLQVEPRWYKMLGNSSRIITLARFAALKTRAARQWLARLPWTQLWTLQAKNLLKEVFAQLPWPPPIWTGLTTSQPWWRSHSRKCFNDI